MHVCVCVCVCVCVRVCACTHAHCVFVGEGVVSPDGTQRVYNACDL